MCLCSQTALGENVAGDILLSSSSDSNDEKVPDRVQYNDREQADLSLEEPMRENCYKAIYEKDVAKIASIISTSVNTNKNVCRFPEDICCRHVAAFLFVLSNEY